MDKVIVDLKGSPALVNRNDRYSPEPVSRDRKPVKIGEQASWPGLSGRLDFIATFSAFVRLTKYACVRMGACTHVRAIGVTLPFPTRPTIPVIMLAIKDNDASRRFSPQAARDGRREDGSEKRNGMRGWRNVLGERVTGEDEREEKRSEKEYTVIYEPPSSNSRGEKEGEEEEEEEKEVSHWSSARREGVRMGERLTQEEEKDRGDSDGRGRKVTIPSMGVYSGCLILNSLNRVTYGDIVSNQFHVPARIIHHLAVSVVDSSGSV
ncbi:hypothetical protein ALC56_10904 [Trachymyrmex septentrionalis]|uniref:Uncharacterized protein n=1 Tax=Trachymyrmex septentrionalis TaxID=34720 RepID=A0A195F3H6_9HYME|nr:hypothetical protein ALC56_10904 [Trachymyrmex septentrionalis]